MKNIILIIFLAVLQTIVLAQPQYDGALERYKMKSDEAVREGLVGEYYKGSDFNQLVKVRQDKEIYFDWDYEKPIEELDAEYFSIRWRGKVYAEKPGKYIFTIYTDDGMRVWLNGRVIINAWKDQPPTIYKKRVVLEGDSFYDIRVEYYQKQYQTTAAVFFNHEDERRKPLNAKNTVFGRNLKPSQAKFDYWEEEGLMDQFFVWMGLEEEKEEKEFQDQSYRPVQVLDLKPAEEKKITKKKSTPEKKRVELVEVEEVQIEPTIEEIDTFFNPYENLRIGDTLVVENIYFDQGKSYLRPESYEELDKLYLALYHHPDWRIKIDGHTDNVGYSYPNLELSFDRSKSVYNYLIQKGIDQNRLKFEGFGSSKPVAKNDSEENKQKNRRVEITLIDNELAKRF